MLTSTDFSGLLNDRFYQNFFPIPALDKFRLGVGTSDFQLPDITNNTLVELSEFRSQQPVLLAFTRIFTEKQYCPLCYPHIKELNAEYEQFQSAGIEVLLITSTDKHQSQQVVRDLGLKMPLLSDPSCRVFRAYHVGQALGAPLPAQFLLDKQGKLVYRHLFSFLQPNASIETLKQAISALMEK
jgi:peroxiredoxin